MDTKHKILMKLIYYTRKTENGLNPKNWDLTGKNKGKVMFLPKTWNHPTVVAVILVLAVCPKHVIKVKLLRKHYFYEIICSLHKILEKPSRSTTKLPDVPGSPIRCQSNPKANSNHNKIRFKIILTFQNIDYI